MRNTGDSPAGDRLYVDSAHAVVAQSIVDDSVRFASACFESCSPEVILHDTQSRAMAETCMRNVEEGVGPLTVLITLSGGCPGPKVGLFRRRKCQANVTAEITPLPTELSDDHAAEGTALPESEVVPGTSLSGLIADCIKNPDRSMEHDGLLWTDKALNLPNVSPITHLAVGSIDGKPVEVDINQAENPFTPARIYMDFNDENGEMVLKHNPSGQEGFTREFFNSSDRAMLEARAAELFRTYFVRD
jgi:hypothetical protein